MENITLELLLYLAAGAALGGYVNGLAGFGTGLMSLGIWLQVMSVEEAVPVVAAMSVVSGVQSLWLTRQGVKTGLHRLPRFLVPALIGLPVGAWLLNWIDAAHLKLAVAFFMLFYTAFSYYADSLPKRLPKSVHFATDWPDSQVASWAARLLYRALFPQCGVLCNLGTSFRRVPFCVLTTSLF